MTTTPDASAVPIRLDFDAHAPAFSRALAHLDRAAIKELDRVELDPKLRELVRIRASQLNGCAYCIDTPHRTRLRGIWLYAAIHQPVGDRHRPPVGRTAVQSLSHQPSSFVRPVDLREADSLIGLRR